MRLVVYGDRYAGIWDGGDHGGQMFGRVVSADEAAAPAANDDGDEQASWPMFHGPAASGQADGHATALTWDVATGENVKWKTPIPGLAHSSPIIWGNRMYVTSAVKEGEEAPLTVGLFVSTEPVEDETEREFNLYCLDKRTGDVLWSRTIWKGVPAIKRHPKGSHIASTPATDGKHVVVFFGTEGLHCLDMDGKPLWSKDLGHLDAGWFRTPAHQWGFGSSPRVHDGKVIVQCDVQGDVNGRGELLVQGDVVDQSAAAASFVAAFRHRDRRRALAHQAPRRARRGRLPRSTCARAAVR